MLDPNRVEVAGGPRGGAGRGGAAAGEGLAGGAFEGRWYLCLTACIERFL